MDITQRLQRRARAIAVLALAVSSALNAQTAPTTMPSSAPATTSTATTMPTTVGATLPATLPATAPESVQVTVVPTTGPGAETRPVDKIRLEFKDASLDTIVDRLSEAAGLIVEKEGPLDGRITLTSRQAASRTEALTVLNEVLKSNGYAAVQNGRILHILPREKAKKLVPVQFGADPEAIPDTADMVTQVIPVKSVDAAKLRQDLQPLISADADFASNQGSNSLIMTDSSSNVRRIVKVISLLDQQQSQSSDIYIKQLQFANAAAAAKLISTVFGSDQNQQQQPGGFGGGRGGFFRAMMMGGGPGGPGGPGGGANAQESGRTVGKVTAAADDRTNTLVVVAPPDTVKLIEKVLKVLDADPAAESTVKVFQLEYADASAAAKLINTIFAPEQSSGQGGGGGFGGFGGFGGGFGGRIPAIEGLKSNDRNVKVNAAAADKTNTLVVTAPPDTLKLIADILKALDADPAAKSEVKVFQLKYADSSSAAKLISTVFTDSSSTPGGVAPLPGSSTHLPAIGGLSTSLHGGRVNATSDDRTNTVVVTAPSDAMKVVTSILAQLDANPSAESAMFIYHLRNGVAADIQATMSNLFGTGGGGTGSSSTTGARAGQSLLSSGLGGSGGLGSSGRSGGSSSFGGGGGFGSSSSSFGSPLTSTNNAARPTGTAGNANAGASVRAQSELVGQVVVVADTDTNSLLVSTANRYKEQVQKIIEELDRPVPQVLIKVLVAEVTHERTNDFGPDFSILDTRASGKGLTVAQGLGNAAAAGAASPGLVVSLVEDNLNLTLHALATEGKLDVLSRPYILASDNQQAAITVGQEVPFITNTQISITGQQINTIQYQAVGIILNVTPHINPDGAVTLDVAPEISAISATSVPIGNNITAPVIDNRSAQSRVTIRTGNTIVIGGMMQDQKSTTVSKVPLLGDIPVIAPIFTRYQTDRTKTELLIFLTPHLAPLPEQLKEMSAEEMRNTKTTPQAVEPGAFDDHMKGLKAGETPYSATSRPATIEVKPTPSTQPFKGISIVEPTTKP